MNFAFQISDQINDRNSRQMYFTVWRFLKSELFTITYSTCTKNFQSKHFHTSLTLLKYFIRVLCLILRYLLLSHENCLTDPKTFLRGSTRCKVMPLFWNSFYISFSEGNLNIKANVLIHFHLMFEIAVVSKYGVLIERRE